MMKDPFWLIYCQIPSLSDPQIPFTILEIEVRCFGTNDPDQDPDYVFHMGKDTNVKDTNTNVTDHT